LDQFRARRRRRRRRGEHAFFIARYSMTLDKMLLGQVPVYESA
jgi:hypothetical protein